MSSPSRSFAKHLLCLLLALAPCAFAAPAAPDLRLPLANPGFEQGSAEWNIAEPVSSMSRIEARAARTGGFGLGIVDQDPVNGSNASSVPLPITPGHRYRVTFWSRAIEGGAGCGIYLRFQDTAGKPISGAANINLPSHSTEWVQTELIATAPANAGTVDIWIHSYGKPTGSWDVDDFVLEDLDATGPAGAAPVVADTPASPATTSPASALPLPNPLVPVVFKVDDLVSTPDGGVPERWKRVADLARERQIKFSVGIIANSLEGEKPVYFGWIKEQRETGLFEFWFHGYDHKGWKEEGRDVSEFKGTSYEHQKDHFVRSQALARKKLGFAFTTFGSPFNASDAVTARVLAEDSDITVWLYGDRANPAGKTVLDRVGAVSIEQPLFVPNSAKFIEGYAKHAAGRGCYVIQGHPAQWDDARWAEFVRIVDFLQANQIPVLTSVEAGAVVTKS